MIHHVTFWIIGAILIKECENMCYSVMSTNGRIELLGYPPQPQTPTDPRCIDGGIILMSRPSLQLSDPTAFLLMRPSGVVGYPSLNQDFDSVW